MEERRRFVRLDTRLPLTYKVLPSAQARQSFTKDIGGGGVCLFVSEPVKSGTQLEVVIKLPDRERSIVFTGEVVWCEPYEIIGKTRRERAIEAGLRFLQIAPQDQEAILRHVILNLQPHHPA